MDAGKEIARRAGVETNFTHALIAATPAHNRGGIGWHTDRECPLGTPLLAVGLDGERKVIFDCLENGKVQVHGDYLAMNGIHTRMLRSVETAGYSLSITWRVQKKQKGVSGASKPVIPSEGVYAEDCQKSNKLLATPKRAKRYCRSNSAAH